MEGYTCGKIVKGIVSGIEQYGIFVKIDECYSGLIHISEISNGFVRNIEDYVTIGECIYVQVLEVDEKNHQLKLSIKNIFYKKDGKSRRKKIVETSSGFKTLERKLPFWIEENIKKNKKQTNSIDK